MVEHAYACKQVGNHLKSGGFNQSLENKLPKDEPHWAGYDFSKPENMLDRHIVYHLNQAHYGNPSFASNFCRFFYGLFCSDEKNCTYVDIDKFVSLYKDYGSFRTYHQKIIEEVMASNKSQNMIWRHQGDIDLLVKRGQLSNHYIGNYFFSIFNAEVYKIFLPYFYASTPAAFSELKDSFFEKRLGWFNKFNFKKLFGHLQPIKPETGVPMNMICLYKKAININGVIHDNNTHRLCYLSPYWMQSSYTVANPKFYHIFKTTENTVVRSNSFRKLDNGALSQRRLELINKPFIRKQPEEDFNLNDLEILYYSYLLHDFAYSERHGLEKTEYGKYLIKTINRMTNI